MANKQRQYFISIGLVLMVAIICYFISPFLGYRVVALILLLTVSLIAISFDILPVLVSATLSAFIWVFFCKLIATRLDVVSSGDNCGNRCSQFMR